MPAPTTTSPVRHPLPVRRVTQGPHRHFFGYYDKHQWDASDRYLLALQTDFEERPPRAEDVARIVRIDTHDGDKAEVISETRAWCWQQGCMLQWLPGRTGEIIYNTRIGDRFVAVVCDAAGRTRRVLPRPVYTIAPDSKSALSLNFARLADKRPGYGYAGLVDHWRDELAPEDGIYRMDLETGEHELIVSIAELAARDPDESMAGVAHWVNHLLYNPSGNRFIFLHRWASGRSFRTRMYTANADGTGLHRVPVDRASHFIWNGDDTIIVWATTERLGSGYHVCKDRTEEVSLLGAGTFTRDGHCTVSPDGRWLLTDEYPDKTGNRPLILYRMSDGTRYDVGGFPSAPLYQGEIRCDLHPRWNRAGTMVCFDSVHEGSRQVYVMDVSSLVRG